MKLSEIINSEQALSSLLNINFPAKIAYRLSKIISKIQPDLRFYEEQKNKLIKDLGEEDKEKGIFSVKPENYPKFAEEIQKLQDVDVPLNFGEGKELQKININDLETVNLKANDLVNLQWLFE